MLCSITAVHQLLSRLHAKTCVYNFTLLAIADSLHTLGALSSMAIDNVFHIWPPLGNLLLNALRYHRYITKRQEILGSRDHNFFAVFCVSYHGYRAKRSSSLSRLSGPYRDVRVGGGGNITK